MNAEYRKIIKMCLALLVLLIIVLILPARWEIKSGKSEREYEAAWAKASDAVLYANSPQERQASLHRAKGLHDYRDEGRINEVKDMSWTLQLIRFMFIVAIFPLCWVILRMVIIKLRNLDKSDEDKSKSSATGYMNPAEIHIIGGGLAGSEAAITLSRLGHRVRLSEMRPDFPTPAHRTGYLAELVCSNSLGSKSVTKAKGLLLNELKMAGASVPDIFERFTVPAGQAFAIDAILAAEEVTRVIQDDPNIDLVREEVATWPEGPAIVASGPLTSDKLMDAFRANLGTEFLHFFDAISPSLYLDSIDQSKAFFASRYGTGGDDYLNVPLTEEEYHTLVADLINAERAPIKDFEPDKLFEACLPVEVIASRGAMSLAFGPLKPRGLTDPATGKRPYAVIQLRRETLSGEIYNLVGFQTRLTQHEQARVLRKIPAFAGAKFARYGMMHLNAYLDGPALLNHDLSLREHPLIFIAGQLAGGEGYLEAIATGFYAALGLDCRLKGEELPLLPAYTMSGALLAALTSGEAKAFNPTQAQFRLLPELKPRVRGRKQRDIQRSKRAMEAMNEWLKSRHMKPSAVPEVPHE